MIFQLILWLVCGFVHIWYVPEFEAWLDRAWIVPPKEKPVEVIVHDIPTVVVREDADDHDDSGESWL